MEQPLDIDDTDHAIAHRRSLDVMRKSKQNCDTIIKVGEDEMAVHRNVLMAQSDYFDAMFAHDTLENQTGVVEMKDVRFEPVKKCVDYFYTGKISTSEEGCEDLLHTATLMQVKAVCDKITLFLQSHLSPKSFFEIKKIATKYDLRKLNKVCDEFALDNLGSIAKEEDFNHLQIEYVSQLITSKKSSHSGGEDGKLAIILQWVKADVKNRHEHLAVMMKLVDLQMVSLGYSRHLVETDALCNRSGEIMSILFLAIMDRQNVKSSPAEISVLSQPDANKIIVFDMSSKYLQAFCPSTRRWTNMQELHKDMGSLSICYTAVTFKDELYVLLQNKHVYSIQYTERNSQWKKLGDMLVDHGNALSATLHCGLIYVAGKNSMESYNLKEEKWSKVHSIGISLDECTLFEHSDCIYSFGGTKIGRAQKAVTKYSPNTSSWSSSTPMPNARATPAIAAYERNIYVAGGYRNGPISDVDYYNLATDTWTTLTSMNKPRSCFGIFVFGNKLFAVGHYQDPCNIEAYDYQKKCWEEIAKKDDMEIMSLATVAIPYIYSGI